MHIVLRRRVTNSETDHEQRVKTILAQVSNLIYIQSVEIEDSGNPHSSTVDLRVEFTLQNASSNARQIEGEIRKAVLLRSDFELKEIEGLSQLDAFSDFSGLQSSLPKPLVKNKPVNRVRLSQQAASAAASAGTVASYTHLVTLKGIVVFSKPTEKELESTSDEFVQLILKDFNYFIKQYRLKLGRDVMSHIIGVEFSIEGMALNYTAENKERDKSTIDNLIKQANLSLWGVSVSQHHFDITSSVVESGEKIILGEQPYQIDYTYNHRNGVITACNSYVVPVDAQLLAKGSRTFSYDNFNNVTCIKQGVEIAGVLQHVQSNNVTAAASSASAPLSVYSGVSSPITEVGDAHLSLVKRLNSLIGKDTTVFKPFLDSINERKYSQALRRLCTSTDSKVIALATLLLEFKDKLSIQINEPAGEKKYTAVHHAAMKGNQALYDLLLKNGGDSSLLDADGISPATHLAKPVTSIEKRH